jgi:dTDP-4-dehydrorhamnose 3,5-epimerase
MTPTHPKFKSGPIEGVLIKELVKYEDPRGWLSELFRQDELSGELHPVMAYASMTRPGSQRGPHEHVGQADYFCFFGPSVFRIVLWDNRKDSPTYLQKMSERVGEERPAIVVIPAGVVHTYKNIGNVDGLVINCPNRLYAGERKRDPVDEIRHEKDPDTPFRLEEEDR